MFERSLFGPRVRLKHLVPFLQQLGTMLKAGIHIRQAFEVLERNVSSRSLRVAIRRMSAKLDEGESLEAALQEAGDLFPEMMVRLLAVGETSGNLDRICLELAEYFEWWRITLRNMIARLIYPVFMFTVLVAVLALLTAFGLVNLWGLSPSNILVLYFVGVPALILLPKLWRTLFGKAGILDAVFLYFPFLGKYLRTLLMARFTLALELLLDAGVTVNEALERAAGATGNLAFARAVRPAIRRVMDGDELTPSLAATGVFPREFLLRMDTSETAGSIVEDLARLARYYGDQAQFAIKGLTVALTWGVYISACLVLIYYIVTLAGGYAAMLNQFMP